MYNKKNRILIKLLKFSLVFPIIIIIGCNGHESNESAVNKNVTTEKKSASVKVINDTDLAGIIKNRNGKILFLNLWATWCEPCVEEFPDIVKLDENYKYKNVEVIAVSVDLPSDVSDKVIPFLKNQDAKFKVYVAEEKSSEKIIELLNSEWSGAVPASFIYDESGKQKKFLLGLQTYNEMVSGIESIKTL